MEGVMKTEAVEGLALALVKPLSAAMQEFQDRTFLDEKNHRYHCGGSEAMRLAPYFLAALRADPAAARAVRDAIDPDGLRDANEQSLVFALRRAVASRAGSTTLVIRLAPWGTNAQIIEPRPRPRATYEWSSTGVDARGPNVIGSRNDETLRELEAALDLLIEGTPDAD